MADPVKGSNVLLKIYKGGNYVDFVCATDVSIDFKTDLQSVKTIGDGYWQRYRIQSIGYTIRLSGLIKIGDAEATTWDLLDYEVNMTELLYKMTFDDLEGGLRVISGAGTIESTSINGGTDGFAKSDFTIYGNGPLTITTS